MDYKPYKENNNKKMELPKQFVSPSVYYFTFLFNNAVEKSDHNNEAKRPDIVLVKNKTKE